MKKLKLEPLTKDAVFKAYFGSYQELLVPMLECFLPLPKGSKIISADAQNPELFPAEGSEGKTFVLDLLVEIELIGESGKKEIHTVNVEMQTTHETSLPNRLLAYAARIYSDQIDKGEDYDKLMPVYF